MVEPGYSNITKVGGSVAGNTDVIGANNFVRSTVEYRQYWSRSLKEGEPFDKPRPVLATRLRYGTISGTVPFFEQFFIGGSQSLRGYDNQRFWGSQSFLGSLEYRYPIQRSFNLVGFVDYGGAWNGYGRLRDFTQSNSAKLFLGYGVGAAFRTPLGPIRIDFGFNESGSSKLHFSFGTPF
jgi:outer membrane protein insertion porin family